MGKAITYDLKSGSLSSDCMICTSHKLASSGYPQIRREHFKTRQMHRYLFQLMYSPAEGLDVHHLCNNKECINVEHLTTDTRGRHIQGHMRGNKIASKLTQGQVDEILADSKHKAPWFAEKYGVTPSTVCYIRRRETWKDNIEGGEDA